MTPSNPIRILVVDDSSLVREGLRYLIESNSDMEVVGEGENGREALEMTKKLRPDIITLDIHMPDRGGLEAIEDIMAYCPTPILVITEHSEDQPDLAFQALHRGALDLIPKPNLRRPSPQLGEKIRLLSQVSVIPHLQGKRKDIPRSSPSSPPAKPTASSYQTVILIGASAGGPASLARVLSDFPATFPGAVVVAQHIPAGFARGLAKWLDRQIPLPVKLAEKGEMPVPGRVLLAPDSCHTTFAPHGKIIFTEERDERDLYCPSIDHLMISAAETFGRHTAGILLTGMGDDGARGLKKIRETGGITMVEDQSTCLIYGMPQRALELDPNHRSLPRHELGTRLVHLLSELQK